MDSNQHLQDTLKKNIYRSNKNLYEQNNEKKSSFLDNTNLQSNFNNEVMSKGNPYIMQDTDKSLNELNKVKQVRFRMENNGSNVFKPYEKRNNNFNTINLLSKNKDQQQVNTTSNIFKQQNRQGLFTNQFNNNALDENNGLFNKQPFSSGESKRLFSNQTYLNNENKGLFNNQTCSNNGSEGVFNTQPFSNNESKGLFQTQSISNSVLNKENKGLFNTQSILNNSMNNESKGLFNAQSISNNESEKWFNTQPFPSKENRGLFNTQPNSNKENRGLFNTQSFLNTTLKDSNIGIFNNQKNNPFSKANLNNLENSNRNPFSQPQSTLFKNTNQNEPLNPFSNNSNKQDLNTKPMFDFKKEMQNTKNNIFDSNYNTPSIKSTNNKIQYEPLDLRTSRFQDKKKVYDPKEWRQNYKHKIANLKQLEKIKKQKQELQDIANELKQLKQNIESMDTTDVLENTTSWFSNVDVCLSELANLNIIKDNNALITFKKLETNINNIKVGFTNLKDQIEYYENNKKDNSNNNIKDETYLMNLKASQDKIELLRNKLNEASKLSKNKDKYIENLERNNRQLKDKLENIDVQHTQLSNVKEQLNKINDTLDGFLLDRNIPLPSAKGSDYSMTNGLFKSNQLVNCKIIQQKVDRIINYFPLINYKIPGSIKLESDNIVLKLQKQLDDKLIENNVLRSALKYSNDALDKNIKQQIVKGLIAHYLNLEEEKQNLSKVFRKLKKDC